jgi:hypothetical protein
MNQLLVGTKIKVRPPSGGCLFIGDQVSEIPHKFRPKIFDPLKHRFNPLTGMAERWAQDLAALRDLSAGREHPDGQERADRPGSGSVRG